MKKINIFLILSLVIITAYGGSLSYNFEKGLCLEYTLELDTKLHFDSKNRDKFIHIRSQYLLVLYVLEKGPEGESIIAATSHLENASVNQSDRAKYPKIAEDVDEWLDSFERDDFAAFILDPWGNLIRGRMLWPEATCYHISKMMEGLTIRKTKESFKRHNCFQINNKFQGVEKVEDRVFSIYKTDDEHFKLKLLVDNKNSVPFSLEVKYGYNTLRSILEQNLRITLSRFHNIPNIESFLDNDFMLAAIIQSSLLSKKPELNPEILEKALFSHRPRIRIVSSGYIAAAGIPGGLDLTEVKKDKNEIVRFNLAKAEFRFNGHRNEMGKYLKNGSKELKIRATNLLAEEETSANPEDKFDEILREYEKNPEQFQEKNVYRFARAVLLKKRELCHFGPSTYPLISGVHRRKCFRYNVWTPEDYDPGERYSLLIGFSGGNGFAESSFMGAIKLLPNHYILISPDSGYGMWWEPDQTLMFDDLLEEVVRNYAIDQDRIFLQGYSNGGIAAYRYGYNHPDRFASICSLMGYSRSNTDPRKVEKEMSLNMRNTPILIIHGAKDRVISIASDRILVDFLRKNSIPHKFYDIKGKGHNLSFGNQHKKVLDYFRKNKRNPAPNKINLIVDDPKYNRNFWIRVDRKLKQFERAQVKAEKKGNKFTIQTKNVKNLSLLLSDLHYDEGSEYEIKINKKTEYQGKLKLDTNVLLESMANENDYARLYGVKLSFEIE